MYDYDDDPDTYFTESEPDQWDDDPDTYFAEDDDLGWDDDDGLTDAEADAMTLASCGWGTDEDYGYYGEDF